MSEMENIEFVDFFEEMFNEYQRHLPKKGESWKTCTIYFLIGVLQKHLQDGLKPMTTQEKMDHVVDIANLCAMVWLRLKTCQERRNNFGEVVTEHYQEEQK